MHSRSPVLFAAFGLLFAMQGFSLAALSDTATPGTRVFTCAQNPQDLVAGGYFARIAETSEKTADVDTAPGHFSPGSHFDSNLRARAVHPGGHLNLSRYVLTANYTRTKRVGRFGDNFLHAETQSYRSRFTLDIDTDHPGQSFARYEVSDEDGSFRSSEANEHVYRVYCQREGALSPAQLNPTPRMHFAEAQQYCEDQGMRLPAIRELAEMARRYGAEIRKSSLPESQRTLVLAESYEAFILPENSEVERELRSIGYRYTPVSSGLMLDFYYTSRSYRPGSLGATMIWSSTPNAKGDRYYMLNGSSGEIRATYAYDLIAQTGIVHCVKQ